MKFIDFKEGQGPQGLFVAQTDVPQPAAHQVRVQVKAFGVNRADTLQREGKYPPPPGESDILGLEVAGIIDSQGIEVKGFEPGDRVCALVPGGGYAQYAVADYRHLIRLPESLSFTEGAGLAEVFLTAFQCLHTIGEVKQGQRALIHAGASGVGLAALQLCRYFGVEAATTASSAEKLSLCETMGASLSINYKTDDFSDVLKKKWPQGADFILDMVGGDYLNRNLTCLRQDGTLVYLAMLAGRYADKLDLALMLAKRARVQGTTLRSRSDDYKAALVSDFTGQCLSGFDSGELRVNIDTVFDAEDIGQAHSRMAQNSTQGKLIGVW